MKVIFLLLGICLSTGFSKVTVKDVRKAMESREIFRTTIDSREIQNLTGRGRALKLEDRRFSCFETKFGIIGFGECPIDARHHPLVCDGILIGLNPDGDGKYPAARFEVAPRLVGISLGLSEAAVRKKFGTPLREQKIPCLNRNCTRLWYNLEDASGDLTGGFLCAYLWRGRVIALSLTTEITSW